MSTSSNSQQVAPKAVKITLATLFKRIETAQPNTLVASVNEQHQIRQKIALLKDLELQKVIKKVEKKINTTIEATEAISKGLLNLLIMPKTIEKLQRTSYTLSNNLINTNFYNAKTAKERYDERQSDIANYYKSY